MGAAFAALPGWSLTEIENCPLPVLRMAIEAANDRMDDNNRWQATIHGIKLPEKILNQKKSAKLSRKDAIKGARILLAELGKGHVKVKRAKTS